MTRIGTMVATIASIALLAASCHEKCDDPIQLTFRPELHDYLKPYRPGSWWVYMSNSGVRDSVYVTDYREFSSEQGRENGPCYLLPEVNYILRTTSMDQAGHLYARYGCGEMGNAASLDLAPTSTWPSVFAFSFYTVDGYADAALIDTSLGGIPYVQALLVREDPSSDVRDLLALCLAKDIGIVAYITTTDTFTITNYHIP